MLGTIPIGAVALAVIAALAVAPIRRPRAMAIVTWFSTMAATELPYIFIAIIGASAIGELASGDNASVRGQIALGLNVFSIVALAVVAQRGWRGRPRLQQALDSSLEADWSRRVDPAVEARLRRRSPSWRAVLAPWPFRPRSVVRIADVSYGDAGAFHRLDVYRHRSRPIGAPTLIHLHGGHFRWGRKSFEARALLHHLARRGWTCLSANYRLTRTPAQGFPGHVVDVKRVIAWARDHADEHGIDPETIVLTGSSAGAHLTAMAALTQNQPVFQPGFEASDTSITAVVGFYGYYGPLGTDDPPSTPLDYDSSNAPPALIVHGTNDTYTPVEGARVLAHHFARASPNPVVLAELPGAQHSFDVFYSVRYEAVVDAVAAFLDWVRANAFAAQKAGRDRA